MRKTLIIFAFITIFLSKTAFSAGNEFFATFVVDPRIKEVSVEPDGTVDFDFIVTLDNDFEFYEGGSAPYELELEPEYLEEECILTETDEETGETYCVEYESTTAPNLCPYISFEALDGEVQEGDSYGRLYRVDDPDSHLEPEDLSDTWKLTIVGPTEEEFVGQTLECNVLVDSAVAPVPVFAPPEKTFGSDWPDILHVEATIGEAAAGTLENGLVEPAIGTASSTPFIFTVNYDQAGPVNLIINGEEYQLAQADEIFILEKQFPVGDYEYHFEAGSARFPTTGELEFKSGLFVTPKSSANLRSAPGIGSAIIGTVSHNQVFELLPLNEQLDVYQLVNNHYWLKGKILDETGLPLPQGGFVAEDLLMTIIPDSQPERVKAKMDEVFHNGDFDTLLDADFPLELLLAMSSEESAGTLNNEVVSPDSSFGGIMQIHPSGSGNRNDNCTGSCVHPLGNPTDWSNLRFPLFDLFGVSTLENNDIAYLFKNYINTAYPNTLQGLETNIKDGLAVLEEDKLSWCNLWDNQFHWQPVTWDGYTISVPELKQICAVWLYNGKSYLPEKQYLKRVGEKLATLNTVFPGTTYANEDNLIEKLQIANDHRAEIKVKSPVELRVKDSEGNITGLVSGGVVNEIENAVYDEVAEAVVVFFPEGELTYLVKGTADGTYGLDITETNGEEEIIFSEPAIPITAGAIQEITLNDEGTIATIKVDEDADGDFEDQFRLGKIDLSVYFDFDAHRLMVAGDDHVEWSQYVVEPQRVSLGIESLAYNGAVITFNPPVTLSYEWWLNSAGRITKLESKAEIPGKETVSGVYKLAGNTGATFFKKIFTYPNHSQMPVTATLLGPAALALGTHGGIIQLNWPGLIEPLPILEAIPLLND